MLKKEEKITDFIIDPHAATRHHQKMKMSGVRCIGVNLDNTVPEKVIFRIENMMGWHHSGFNVYCGEAIWPSDQEGIERLAQYIVRAPISQERLL